MEGMTADGEIHDGVVPAGRKVQGIGHGFDGFHGLMVVRGGVVRGR